jgi:hypothetical protein
VSRLLNQGEGSFKSPVDAEAGEGLLRLGGVGGTGGSDTRLAGRADEPDGEVVKGGHQVGDVAHARLREVIREGSVAHVMGAVLDGPMLSSETKQGGGIVVTTPYIRCYDGARAAGFI